jgi:hypothetical protein
MADGEQIHAAMYPGSLGGDLCSEQTEVNIRQHALESACFVVNATAWLDADQQAQIMQDTGCPIGPISSGCFTAVVSPEGELMGKPLRSGEGAVIAELDFSLIRQLRRRSRNRLLDQAGDYATFNFQSRYGTVWHRLAEKNPKTMTLPEFRQRWHDGMPGWGKMTFLRVSARFTNDTVGARSQGAEAATFT